MARALKLVVIIMGLFVLGCAPRQTASTYSPQQMGRAATVMKGKIISMREVNVSGSQSGIGATTGAAAGAVAGSNVGGSTRSNILGAIGGAVVGGIAGATVEQAATEGKAVEFIIQQENGQSIAVVHTNEESLAVGDPVMILRSDRVRIVRDTQPGR